MALVFNLVDDFDFRDVVFSSDSKSDLLRLRQCLLQVRNRNKLVSKYVVEETEILDPLVIADEKTFEFDKVGEEFEHFVQSVTMREGDVSFVQLQMMLGDLEIRQKHIAA